VVSRCPRNAAKGSLQVCSSANSCHFSTACSSSHSSLAGRDRRGTVVLQSVSWHAEGMLHLALGYAAAAAAALLPALDVPVGVKWQAGRRRTSSRRCRIWPRHRPCLWAYVRPGG